jgi:hypothetical protein
MEGYREGSDTAMQTLTIDGLEPLELRLISHLQREEPMLLPWPMEGVPVGLMSFRTPEEWHVFISSLALPASVPMIVLAKFRRAQVLYFLSWLYPDLIKAGELVALTALELALRGCYGNKVKGRRGGKPEFAALLQQMPKDGLTDDKIPLVQRAGALRSGSLQVRTNPPWLIAGTFWITVILSMDCLVRACWN